MNFEVYQRHDATGLAELVRRREVTPDELLAAATSRLEAVNPAINAVIRRLDGEAQRMIAELAPGAPLSGVPFLLKDITARLQGVPTGAGSRLFQDQPCGADSALVAAYRRAGLVIFGKTNTPELGLEPVTEPAMFGPTRNPWDLSRTSGGSSGGAAAAVAAGILPAAHASDGGGSIRTPASCCGLFGLKPSRGRVSFAPKDEGWGGFSCGHVVSWSVRDSAALLDIAGHPEPGDPYWTAPPARPFAESAKTDPAPLRIAFTTGGFASDGIDPECAQAVRAAARLCEALGHRVEEAAPPIDRASLAAAGVVISASVAADLDAAATRRGRPIAEDEVEPVTWASYDRGRTIGASLYIQSLRAAHALGRAVAAFHQSYDILICATLGSPAIPVGYLHGDPPDPRGYARRLFDFMPNTQAFNITGQPAASLPLGMSAGGLPIGVQFVARQGEDALLFGLAGQIERAAPWAGLRPSLA